MFSAPYSSHTYLSSMSFPPIEDVPQLQGKSNFHAWRSVIQPILLTNRNSADLIVGGWTEPPLLAANEYPTVDRDVKDLFERARHDWHAANTGTCRFIRTTLAMNVTPFVRQHETAAALFFNLIWLYGDEAGIDTQGGPSVPCDVKDERLSKQRDRAGLFAALKQGPEARGDRIMGYLGPVNVGHPPTVTATPNASSSLIISSTGILGSDLTATAMSSSGSNSSLKGAPIPSILPSGTVLVDGKAYSTPLETTSGEDTDTDPALLTSTQIYERSSPGYAHGTTSLHTIFEGTQEPHPGRRVSFGLGRRRNEIDGHGSGSVSPLTLSDTSSPFGGDFELVSRGSSLQGVLPLSAFGLGYCPP